MNAWTPLIPVALMLFAFGLRKLTPSSGFLHTAAGATVIAFASGLLGALAEAIQAHGFTTATIVPAIASFVMSFIATANPSLPAAPNARTKQIDGASLRALLPLAFVALALSGCATAGGKALKACELSQLPAEEQALASSVANIALDVGSTVVDLEQLALAVGKAQFSCVAQAVAAWLAAPAPAIAPTPEVANALLQASADARRDHARQVLEQYLTAHPSACALRQAL
jgi:hypothetical protein